VSARLAGVWLVFLFLVAPALHALAQAGAARPALATVGGRRVEREEFDARVAAAERQLAARAGERPAELRDVLRRQVLETLIRMNLLILEAQRLQVSVSAAEAESALRADPFFSPGGTFDAARWQLTRTTQPERFQGALATTRERLAARRLDTSLQARFGPPEAELRARAARQLRRAFTEDLSLRVADFNGHHREPRETEVVAYHRDRPEEFRRTDRAVISVAFVNEPPRTRHEIEDARAGAAWTARMRRAADSVLALVQGGQTLEDASAGFGGPRGDVTVVPDNFPGYWKGTAAHASAVFRARAGSVLPEPVPSTEGFLLVRVDEVRPSHVAPLREVARDIRFRLREDARAHHDERERRALYEQLRDSLSGPAWRFRWTAVDTATVSIPEPSAAELERWYRGHLADYSSFDPASGSIVARTFDQVRDDVRLRWRRDKRLETARLRTQELLAAWSAGRRAAGLERELGVRLSRPTPEGAEVDTGFAGAALSDTVWGKGAPSGAASAAYARGFLVWQVAERLEKHTPSFDQVEPALQAALERARRSADEAGGRRLYDQDPSRFATGRRYHFTRMVVNHPPLDAIRLTRAEVERWHRRNLDKYSAPELARAKHVLISPVNETPAADRAARARADSLLARIRAGDDFDAIAARFSDDPATKDKGGDLGVFARGAMLQPFEDAVFASRAGDLGGPVRTEVGWHIFECTEYVPAFVQSLNLVYSMVASDLARVKADTVAQRRADSLLRVVRTVTQARAAAQKLGLGTYAYVHAEEDPMDNTALVPYFERLFKLKPGEIMPVKQLARGEGYWITWVDSISPPRRPSWNDARARAIAAYREGAGERTMQAKVAELDSLLASGWSFDSLGVLWGGLTRSRELAASGTNPNTSLPAAMDSLVFGHGDRPPALTPGQLSGWVRWPGGLARVRLLDRTEPAAGAVRARMDELRRAAVERRMAAYYDDLRKRYTVRILDRGLAAIPLPEPPPDE
jgi:parvulin-like peptidyl-prolyl isomerase